MIDAHRLWLQGRQLSADDAEAMEATLATSPDDVGVRIQLLGYYSVDWRTFLKERNRHTLWFIAHHPELDLSPFTSIDESFSPEAYTEAQRLWRSALERQPGDPAVLAAASAFFTSADSAFAKELIRRGATVEPHDARWPRSLGNVFMLDVRHEPVESVRITAAREALIEFQQALELEPSESERYGLLINAAEAAFYAGDHETACAFASRLLADAHNFEGTWIHGNGVHHAHVVLGRVALARGDVQRAKESLLASVQAPPSPQLKSFGPDQELAAALLAHGERNIVQQYVDACRERFGASLGLLGALHRSADGGPPSLRVVHDDDDA